MKPCFSYCNHGGVCLFEEGHKENHNSGYCTWTDEEAISKEEANKLFLMEAKFQEIEPWAAEMIAFSDAIEEKLKEVEN